MNLFRSLFIFCLFIAVVFCLFSSAFFVTFQNRCKNFIILDTISYKEIGKIQESSIIIDKEVNLEGKLCQIPRGITLAFNGGVLKNGYLGGNGTRIEGDSIHIFDRVTIQGTWNVPKISTRMFCKLDYENSLRDVVALSDARVKNHILIEKGNYVMSVSEEEGKCISLNSNANFELHGTIRLKPNVFKSYYIIYANGKNIKITGDGTIIGDKDTHKGKKGEWGMGVGFNKAIHSSIIGVIIKDCWGDCIYVGGNSKDITIEDCNLVNGRRQGISITKADGVIVRNCKIRDVSGTKPEFAIDLEPNKNCTVDHVLIENVEIDNCEGGIVTSKGTKMVETKRIGKVVVRNCSVSVKSKYPISIKSCEMATVENCTIYGNSADAVVFSKDCDRIIIKDNIIYVGSGNRSRHNMPIQNYELKESETLQSIKILSSGFQEVVGNVIKK